MFYRLFHKVYYVTNNHNSNTSNRTGVLVFFIVYLNSIDIFAMSVLIFPTHDFNKNLIKKN